MPLAARNIKSFFRPLDLDEDGLCEACSRLSKKQSSDDEEYDGDASKF